jgi:protein-histidine pros-kinase
MEEILGYEEAGLEGLNIRVLIPEDERAANEERIARFLETGERDPDAPVRRLVRKDGKLVEVSASVRPFTTISGSFRTAMVRNLTEENRLIDDLDRQSSRLKAIVDTAVDGIITIDESGTITFVNIAVERLFGYTADELMGQNVAMLMPEPYHSEHDDYLGNYHRTGQRKIIGIGRTVSGLKKNGEVFPLELAVSESITRQGRFFTGIIHDITQRMQAEDELRRERALFKTVLDQAPDGLLLLTEADEIISANPAFAAIMKADAEAVVGQPFWNFVAKDDGAGRTLKLEHGVQSETMGRRMDGTTFPMEISVASASTSDGRVLAAFVRDISERKRHEQIRLEKESADRSNAAKSEFLSRMSHELRTPLNAVIGYSQLLSFKFPQPEVQEGTSSILKAGRHLLSLINEVLDLASIDAGRFAISLEPVQLGPVILQALELISPIALEANITLDYQADLCAEEAVLADRQRLLQVFINLISNGIKYNRPKGQVTIRCESINENRIRINFEDTGVGILDVDRARLFQPFERLGTQVVEGSGLGLVLSRRFVELMGGKLDLLSSDSQGSSFAIDLRHTVMPAVSHMERTEGMMFRPTFNRQIQILYIEDNSSNMKLMEMILAEWSGVSMMPAVQGQVGLEIAQNHRPDLILLDLHLPDMPGEQVLRLLKSDDDTAKIPVIVVSADATNNQIRRLMAAGADDYVTKPIDLRQFTMVVERLLNVAQ